MLTLVRRGAFVAALQTLSVAMVFAQSPTRVKLLQGEYLSSDYISAIKRTHSLKRSGSFFKFPCFAVVTNFSDSTARVQYGNFHEGYGDVLLFSDGSVKSNDTYSMMPTDPIMTVTARRFRLIDQGKSIYFDFVGNAQSWVGSHVFDGRYVDSKGHGYLICDSLFITPDNDSLSFAFDLDPVIELIAFDHLYIGKQVYRYVPRSDSLYIYPTYKDTDETYSSRRTPKWIIVKADGRGSQ